jgi:hypothetical protein
MRIPFKTWALVPILALCYTTIASAGAFDYAERWGGYWRRYDQPFGRRYEAPPTLYYGHAPEPADYGSKLPYRGAVRQPDEPLYLRAQPSNTGDKVPSYDPAFYGRGRYFGPAIDPYYAPGRSHYAGVHYGWW